MMNTIMNTIMDISARHFAKLAIIGQSDNVSKVARGSMDILIYPDEGFDGGAM